MVSRHGIKSCRLSMNRPTPAPLPGGERAFTRVFRFPSWEGVRGGFMVPMHAQKRMEALHEPSEAPPGFGVRQSSGALAMEAIQPKAPEDWRSPRRCRAVHGFMVPMHFKKKWTLSMKRPFGVPALAGPGRLKAGLCTDGAIQTSSSSQCMRKNERRLFMIRRV